jgi:hypothetical protein
MSGNGNEDPRPPVVGVEGDAERQRLAAADRGEAPWRRWGPYLAERQWGTVREDYSADGDAWRYFPHEHARSRAYRWGEDGLAGVCDERQRLCLALALWNGRDPILKERLFGLGGHEGNHGEDVKELYWYLDATPTASWLEMLYRYPLAEFPYARLLEENARRGHADREFELLDTGILDDDAYVDVYVRYAKAAPEDLLMEIALANRGRETATLVVMPQLWFRNTWAWGDGDAAMPRLAEEAGAVAAVEHPELERLWLQPDVGPDGHPPQLCFCDNESHAELLWNAPGRSRYPKDAFHDLVVHGNAEAVSPHGVGTKAGLLYRVTLASGEERTLRLRLAPHRPPDPFADFAAVMTARRAEADAFYATLLGGGAQADRELQRVQRQAYAGMIWCKQTYGFDVSRWLAGDPGQPPPPASRQRGRDHEWFHFNSEDVLSMPDSWEYPWFAAWDLAFHCLPLVRLDPHFAKHQLVLLLREWYMHPNGQLPAYEWNFGDVNPPVHAWAAWRVFEIDRETTGKPDHHFLERVFLKLLLNFTWWVNRKDVEGRNVFQGGFLGLDNIGVFDRSSELPTGGHLDQADGTGWMAMYCLNMLRIALELSLVDSAYEDIATKFFEHFLYVAAALTDLGGRGVDFWSEEDEFFYDVLQLPSGDAAASDRLLTLRVRSMVGLVPLFAVEVLDGALLQQVPAFARRLEWFLAYRPDLASLVSSWTEPGSGDRRLLSLLRRHRLKRVLERMLDESEFLSPFGVRGLSRFHRDHPYTLQVGSREFSVDYEPGESRTGLFGGNSNWRGPIWFPVNFLIVESLRRFHGYYGDDFVVECPAGSGRAMNLGEVADELSRRLVALFLPGPDGVRPSLRVHPKQATDARFRDLPLFWEHFDGDDGRGLGASHQTGWTGLVTELARDLQRTRAGPRVERRVASRDAFTSSGDDEVEDVDASF